MSRTSLVESIAQKRVKFLDYLKEIHSDDGALWMNTVHLKRVDLCRHFSAEEECADEDHSGGTTVKVPLDVGCGGGTSSEFTGEPAAQCVALHRSLASKPPKSSWANRYILSFVALAYSLADLLAAAMRGDQFAECFHGLLLEVEMNAATGPAAKALAQRNVKHYRQHLSSSLVAALASSLPSGESFAALEGGPKYLFLRTDQLSFLPTRPSYGAVVPSVLSLLILAYQRFCDVEFPISDTMAHHIVQADRCVQKLVLDRLCSELQRVAQGILRGQMTVLSTKGLFSHCSEEGESGGAALANFFHDLDTGTTQLDEVDKDEEDSETND